MKSRSVRLLVVVSCGLVNPLGPLQAALAPDSVAGKVIVFDEGGMRRSSTTSYRLRADGSFTGGLRIDGSFVERWYGVEGGGLYTYEDSETEDTATLTLHFDDSNEVLVKVLTFETTHSGRNWLGPEGAGPDIRYWGTFELKGALDESDLRNTAMRTKVDAMGRAYVGFVTNGQIHVLIRVVGPTLARFGVESPVMSPELQVTRGGEPLSVGQTRLATETTAEEYHRLAQFVGAFPLEEGSADQQLLFRPAAGAYVVEVHNPTATAGEVLIEVYTLPF